MLRQACSQEKGPESATCVQNFDDSWNPAIHITYRTSLRSSSLREPRDPLLKVVFCFFVVVCFFVIKKVFFILKERNFFFLCV